MIPTKTSSSSHLVYLLQKCMKNKVLKPGKQLHALLLTSAYFNTFATNFNSKLVGMYASCGDLNSARKLFDEIPDPDVFAVNWMVLASSFNGDFDKAIGYFSFMREKVKSCNKFTFSILLKACVGLLDLNKGKEVHSMVYQMGFESDVSVGNALIDMYCKCGHVSYGSKVFDKLICRDVASWTSLICGYCNTGKIEQAMVLFDRMRLEGLEHNEFTWNAMIAGYARRGDANGAFRIFSRMVAEGLVPDLVTWNAMISGFAQSKLADEAFKLFHEMLVSGVKPNLVTMTGLLPACGLMGSIQRGREIQGWIHRMGLDINVFVASAVIDMYSKCGSVKDARNVFDMVQVKNTASWNAMIGCYGKHGMVDAAVELFERMQKEGMQPNEVTFTAVLSACSHGDLVEKGLMVFQSMQETHRILISNEHYACLVDMLCRSGKMEEAYELIRGMHIKITDSIAGAFFNGCIIHQRRDLAIMVSGELGMNLKKPADFVSLSNIYAADGEWHQVENLRNSMKEQNVHKIPGFSWFEKNAYSFRQVEDKSSTEI